MEPIVLTDPNVQPTEELIYSIIGKNSIYWQQIIHYLYDNYSNITEQWRFYNDGKSWLYRALRKKKTIYWIGILNDTFRISFYLSDKAELMIEESSLSDKIKEEFADTKLKKFRAVTVEMHTAEDLENVLKLIEIKLKLK
jgi:Protein of unknown function (DUF3788)